jgi:hypothetical protein
MQQMWKALMQIHLQFDHHCADLHKTHSTQYILWTSPPPTFTHIRPKYRKHRQNLIHIPEQSMPFTVPIVAEFMSD